MNLDEEAKKAVQELGEAINSAIEKSPKVIDAIQRLREIGYEPNLTLRLEIGLQELLERFQKNEINEIELDLTEEDLKTLHRMKIKI
ncbi:MAG: SAM domain-containing protein [Acidobacteriota bacterium]